MAEHKRTTLSDLSPDTIKEIQNLLRADRKIQAIIVYRQKKNIGVGEAKQDIDRESEFLGLSNSM